MAITAPSIMFAFRERIKKEVLVMTKPDYFFFFFGGAGD
jgi:hypothetical protein